MQSSANCYKLERARSISPVKDLSSDTGTPNSMNSKSESPSSTKPWEPLAESARPSCPEDTPRAFDGNAHNAHAFRGSAASSRDLPQVPSKPVVLSNTSPTAAVAPSRAGTLSWQQRPTSRGSGGPRSRPLSMVATENSAWKSPREVPDPSSTGDIELSRNQIVQSLGSKDPAWFRQTADRGLGSAAYRKGREEDVSDTASMTRSVLLPGLSREATEESRKELSSPPENPRSASPSRESSVRGSSGWSHRYSSSASLSSASGIRSPLPTMNSQRFEPPTSDTTSQAGDFACDARASPMSPSQERISPERVDRPISPTKGLGGFVQSAMLKRSDSVNKRWSAQAGPGLSRGNSIASNRSGYDGQKFAIGQMSPTKEQTRSSLSRENSPLPHSRPNSSHSNVTITRRQGKEEGLSISAGTTSGPVESPNNGFLEPLIPQPTHASATMASPEGDKVISANMSPPASPSKAIDSKKWSPTKASWLESAINKPDSPKLKAAPPQQPSWMAEINRVKQQRGSVDLRSNSNYKEVAADSLMRSPPEIDLKKHHNFVVASNNLNAGTSGKVPQDRHSDTDLMSADVTPEPMSIDKSNSSSSLGKCPTENKISSPAILEPATTSNGAVIPSISETRRDSPSSAKPKPQTPPKKDFRSALKTRQVSAGKEGSTEPEFRNVFGKLKRTQTQNYVPPDELKDNILRGKAGLALTGGPKKTERKDELKESILKQKEAMKAGTSPGMPRNISVSSNTKGNDPLPPEALAKRKDLTKSENVSSHGGTDSGISVDVPEALVRQKVLREKPKPLSPEREPIAPPRVAREPIMNGKLADRFNPALLGVLSREPPPMTNGSKPSHTVGPDPLPSNASETAVGDHEETMNGTQLTHITKSRAKGPKRRLPAAKKQDVGSKSPIPTISSEAERPLPKVEAGANSESTSLPSSAISIPEARPLANITNKNDRTSTVSTNGKPFPSVKLPDSEAVKCVASPASQTPLKEPTLSKPKTSPVVKKKPTLSPKTDQIRKPSITKTRSLPSPPAKPPNIADAQRSFAAPAEVQRLQRFEAQEEEPIVSVKGAAALWGHSSGPRSSDRFPMKSPIKLPTRKDEQATMDQAGLPLNNSQELLGLGIQTTLTGSHEPSSPLDRNLPSPPLKSPRSPPLPAKKPDFIAGRIVSNPSLVQPLQQASKSPVPRTSEAVRLFTDFFDEVPISKSRVPIDAQAILTSRPSSGASGKIKTLRKQMWEISVSGKKLPVPPHQEHILFEENLYLCTHVFGTSTGNKTTEIYLWCGDGVALSAAEDAQLFARRVAKENNGKLIILNQGKETSNFFQALGGIVITRRGSSSRAESSSNATATYMLCGRRHIGQIAFDEVDFNPKSLYGGFPYIISARFGKLYLWKGKGSNADELGCARLIGMDLGLTGEIEEVDEGNEPAGFWEVFPNGKQETAMQAGHWHRKSSCENYNTRMFNVDVETPPKTNAGFKWGRRGSAPAEDGTPTAQIREVTPFAQSDFFKDGIFVLDAFFEIYVYVPLNLRLIRRHAKLISSTASLGLFLPPNSPPSVQPYFSRKNMAYLQLHSKIGRSYPLVVLSCRARRGT